MASHLTDFYIVGDSDCYVYAILKLRWRSSSTPEPTFLIQLVVVSSDPPVPSQWQGGFLGKTSGVQRLRPSQALHTAQGLKVSKLVYFFKKMVATVDI
jgi:hypothetical protein